MIFGIISWISDIAVNQAQTMFTDKFHLSGREKKTKPFDSYVYWVFIHLFQSTYHMIRSIPLHFDTNFKKWNEFLFKWKNFTHFRIPWSI